MNLSERQRQLVDGHQVKEDASRPPSAEWSIRVGMLVGFLLVLAIEGLLLLRIFLQ